MICAVGCDPVSIAPDAGVDIGDCYQGNYTINDAAGMIFFKSYTCITGNLAINIHDDVIVDLPHLLSVKMSLYIHDNDNLADLSGLENLESIDGDLWIFNNPVLPDCEACDLLDQLGETPEILKVHNNLDDACAPVPEGC
jgi:hypothetical protein